MSLFCSNALVQESVLVDHQGGVSFRKTTVSESSLRGEWYIFVPNSDFCNNIWSKKRVVQINTHKKLAFF